MYGYVFPVSPINIGVGEKQLSLKIIRILFGKISSSSFFVLEICSNIIYMIDNIIKELTQNLLFSMALYTVEFVFHIKMYLNVYVFTYSGSKMCNSNITNQQHIRFL